MRALFYVVPVALAVYALFDLSASEPHERAGIRRLWWAVAIVLLPLVGPLVWVVTSRTQAAKRRPQRQQQRPSAPGRTFGRRPKAPDDDPEFLWRLEQERRRQAHEGDAGDRPGEDPTR